MAKMALEILWVRCDVVTAARTRRGKLWTVPERIWPDMVDADGDWARWALLERVEAAGLLRRAGGPQWSVLREVQRSELPEQLVAEGRLESVQIEGSRRSYLAPKGFLEREYPDDDGRMRVLGPLDPLIWDRDLVRLVWGFEYLWEVYKPKHQRRWGYYVTPLLHEGQLVGRFEGHTEDGRVVVDRVWREDGVALDDQAFEAAVARLS